MPNRMRRRDLAATAGAFTTPTGDQGQKRTTPTLRGRMAAEAWLATFLAAIC